MNCWADFSSDENYFYSSIDQNCFRTDMTFLVFFMQSVASLSVNKKNDVQPRLLVRLPTFLQLKKTLLHANTIKPKADNTHTPRPKQPHTKSCCHGFKHPSVSSQCSVAGFRRQITWLDWKKLPKPLRRGSQTKFSIRFRFLKSPQVPLLQYDFIKTSPALLTLKPVKKMKKGLSMPKQKNIPSH